MHLERNLKNFSKHAEILLFYFAGNDFHYEFKKNKKFIFYQGIPIPYLTYKIRFGYERLERNKDKFFMKISSKLYNKNFFYKKIRPKSQRLTKSMLANWTKTCPVEYHYINKIKVGFYYKPPTNFISVRTHIITNDEILKKIKKIYYIPTKFQVYSKYINNEEIKNDDYKYLKLNYEKLGIEVEDLTDILVKSADINLKNNKLIYWKDDTHWNKIGITTAIKHIAKQF